MQKKPLRPGDHVFVSRVVYAHHGIYIGQGRVVHFTGAAARIEDASIRYDSLETFAAGGTVEVMEYARSFSEDEVVRRARSRIGENGLGAAPLRRRNSLARSIT
jgi:hypothetical protein